MALAFSASTDEINFDYYILLFILSPYCKKNIVQPFNILYVLKKTKLGI